MASKWLDFWAYANWTDATKRPLFTIIEDIKGAADERVASYNMSHDSSFPDNKTFPFTAGDLTVGSAKPNPPSNDTNIQLITQSIYPDECVKTDSIETSGTVASGDIPENLTLSDLLTGPLGYASGTLLSDSDTDGGDDSGLARMAWVKQWFEVMDYPVYYNRHIKWSAIEPGYIAGSMVMERQFVRADLQYGYNDGASPAFNGATMEVRSPQHTSVPTDVYVTNDLNESAPFSTVAECRDYCIDSFNNEVSDDNWLAANNLTAVKIFTSIEYVLLRSGDDVTINIDIRHDRIRFKVNDQYRAISPGRYTVPVKWNGYYTTDNTWSDFGTGETEDEIIFVTLTADGSDYFYLEIDTPDYTSPSAPAIPATDGTNSDHYSIVRYSLTADMATITTVLNSVYVELNKDDGSAWEYYTP